MIKRSLKYYEWQLENGTVILFDKKLDHKTRLSLAMADSLMRAYISFKNTYRLQREADMRSGYKSRIEKLQIRLALSKLKIKKKEIKNNGQSSFI